VTQRDRDLNQKRNVAVAKSNCLTQPTPPVATRILRFRQFVDQSRQNPVKIHRKIGKFQEKNKVTDSGGTTGEGGESYRDPTLRLAQGSLRLP
jgi:hypothetical protein